ncbi:MAG: hypothetical protein AAGD43_23930 [Pseudomonadota bacterium]
MTYRITSLRTLGLIGATLFLTGCGSLKLPSLSTGSIGSSSQSATPAAPAVKPDDPVERAVQVGATIARAQKCGYYFDPAQLKANYLAAESVRYPAPDVQQKVQTGMEFARIRVTRNIAPLDSYCTKARTEKIKKNLTRYLAGDYTAEVKKVVKEAGLFDGLTDAPVKEEKFNPGRIYDPVLNE